VTFVLGKTKEYIRDWVPFLILLLSYEALQGIAGSLAASRGVFSIYSIDEKLWGFNLTGAIQNSFYSNLVTDLSTFFYSLHFALVAILAITLWYSRKILFKRYAMALVISSYVSLTIFLLVPTSPPWYVGVAVNLLSKPAAVSSNLTPAINAIDSATKSFVSDKFAAFPSLHAAYAILFGFYMTKLKRSYGLFAIPISIGILFSTLYLGQHYLIDLIGGAAVAFGAIAISSRVEKSDLPSEVEASKIPIDD
jgi:membrane-associated phospholipid phosphatase